MDSITNVDNNYITTDMFGFSRYIGGLGEEEVESIAIGPSGDIFITGYTNSHDFPTTAAFNDSFCGAKDCFVSKLDGDDGSLIYSTFIGGSASDYGQSIAVDDNGNAFVTGYTSSQDFPVVNPFNGTHSGGYDCFVLKLNSAGDELLYSTFVGSYSNDYPESIILDDAGNAYVTGATFAFENYTNFPTINAYDFAYNGGEADCFVFKLNANGNELKYSTIVGGTLRDHAYAIDIDENGSAYVTGDTDSPDFPTINAYDDTFGPPRVPECFVFKLSPTGNRLVYSTFVAGSDSDHGWALRLDDDGCVYVSGETNSHDFPTVNEIDNSFNGGWSDCFVFKLSTTGDDLLFSSYIGGEGDDEGASISIDSQGIINVVGYTSSIDFPTAGECDPSLDGPSDIVVFQLNNSDESLLHSSYIGGEGNDWANSLVLDSTDNIYVAGKTDSSNFPTIDKANSTFSGGKSDCFVFKITKEDSEINQIVIILILMSIGAVIIVVVTLYKSKFR